LRVEWAAKPGNRRIPKEKYPSTFKFFVLKYNPLFSLPTYLVSQEILKTITMKN
jgi:hypothetical protein